MDVSAHLAQGFSVAFSLYNVLCCLIGVVLGTLIGVLPGIGPVATISMLLPITYHLPPTAALIMLAGIYYGAQYGGSTTSILVNLPGEASSVVTCLDGYQMARQGRAGQALAVAAIGSFIAGCFATIVLAGFAPPLSEVALKFGPADYFSLMLLGLIAAVVLAQGSILKALCLTILGVLLGLIGMDQETGDNRFTFGSPHLSEGIEFVVIGMGLFGFGPMIANLERPETREVFAKAIGKILPNWKEMRPAWGAIARGTGVGSALGILPGGGAVLGAFAAYMLEKKIARDPKRFGRGAIEGVAAPESANNAAAQTSFIPMLTLGIPTNAVMALMISAMTVHGIQPGPLVMTKQPDIIWGMVASMWIGNILLVILNLPLIGIWVKLLSVPYRYLYPAILVFCAIGLYSVRSNPFDIMLAAGFGFIGYLFIKLEMEPTPLVLGFVLGSQMEDYFRKALTIQRGDPSVFFTSPISAVLLVLCAILLIVAVTPAIRRGREEAFREA